MPTLPPMAPESAAPPPRRPLRLDRKLRFGDFELLAPSGELFRRGRRVRLHPVRLQPQPAKALVHLVEHAGRLVTRTELQEHLWGPDRFVDHEQGLNYCIREIRRALDDDAARPRFLETVPRRGYRFLGQVRSEAGGSAARDSAGHGAPGFEPVSSYPRLGRRHVVLCALLTTLFTLLGVLGMAGALAEDRPPLYRKAVALLPFVVAVGLPCRVLSGLGRPKVRIGPGWIESYSDADGRLRRERLADLVGVRTHDHGSIDFELRDGRELRILRRHVGRFDWPELRAELAARLRFHEIAQRPRSQPGPERASTAAGF